MLMLEEDETPLPENPEMNELAMEVSHFVKGTRL